MARVLEIVLAAKDNYTPTLQKSFADFVAWRRKVDAEMRSASRAQQYGGYEENFRAKFARDREDMIRRQIADSKRLADATGQVEKGWGSVALRVGATAAAGRGVFDIFTRIVDKLETGKGTWREVFEGAWGTGAAARTFSWFAFRHEDRGAAAEKEKEERQRTIREASASFRSEGYRFLLTEQQEEELQARERHDARLAALIEVSDEDRKLSVERLEFDLAKIQERYREENRTKLIASLDRDHHIEVDAYRKRIAERHQVEAAERAKYLARMVELRDAEDERISSQFESRIRGYMQNDPGVGSDGTVAAGDVTNNLRGLAVDARIEAARESAALRNKIDEVNATLQKMLEIDRQTGGALGRFLESAVSL